MQLQCYRYSVQNRVQGVQHCMPEESPLGLKRCKQVVVWMCVMKIVPTIAICSQITLSYVPTQFLANSLV